MTRAVPTWRVVGTLLIATLVSGLLGAAATTADARPATTPIRAIGKQALPRSGAPYLATLLTCRRSGRTEARSATVGAAMRPVPGGRRLALRVDLQQRQLAAGGRWTTRTDVPGLGVWTQPSDPSIGSRAADVFNYRQTVGRLVVPYAYRFRVSFRWFDAAGKVVREASALTAQCREPDLRPDLTIVRIDVEPHRNSAIERYVVLVKNAGRTTASNVGVGVSTDPAAQVVQQRTIRTLRPQEMSEVTLLAGRCDQSAGLAFVVDPLAVVDEADEENNTLAPRCPATLQRP